jgi:alpha-tubulin suppressor-like RCC1 family protein
MQSARIVAGNGFTFARTRGGATLSWGSDLEEALGNGAALGDRSAPGATLLAGAFDTIATGPGARHGLAIERASGRVWNWGSNWAGQLGDRSQLTRPAPVVMRDVGLAEISGASAVAAGAAHSLVLRNDGAVLAAGLNDQGQLGNGTAQSRDFAAPVAGVCDGMAATAIAAGADFSLALCADGSVRAWGANTYGQLGDGTFAQRSAPVVVAGLAGRVVKAIAAGASFALALDSEGFVWSWGSNARGQLGTDVRVELQRNSAGRVAGFANAVAIAAGLEHALVVLANHVVLAWGANDSGQVGLAPATVDASFLVGGLPLSIVEIAAGANHSLAVDSAGRVWAWGGNAAGQLGLGNNTPVNVPTLIGGFDLN